jgi:hypothetical protein
VVSATRALDLYGRLLGAYPWPKLTVVVPPEDAAGAGGMEYPTLVTTGSNGDYPLGIGQGVRMLEVLSFHEIAHEWFPMQVQTNEAAEPWLDEGFADYLTTRALAEFYGFDRSVLDLPFVRLGYASLHRATLVAALHEPLVKAASEFEDQSTYSALAYSKGSLALLTLERTLGREQFDAGLRAYADRWRWRHPTSADFVTAMDESTGTDLRWFADSFLYHGAVADYRVPRALGSSPTVTRTGDAAVPVTVEVQTASGATEQFRWEGREREFRVPIEAAPFSVAVDPQRHLALQSDRVDDARVSSADPQAALSVAARWLGAVQTLVQLVGQFG